MSRDKVGLLNLVKDVKGSNRSYMKNGSSLLYRARDMMTQDMEKAMLWNVIDCQ